MLLQLHAAELLGVHRQHAFSVMGGPSMLNTATHLLDIGAEVGTVGVVWINNCTHLMRHHGGGGAQLGPGAGPPGDGAAHTARGGAGGPGPAGHDELREGRRNKAPTVLFHDYMLGRL